MLNLLYFIVSALLAAIILLSRREVFYLVGTIWMLVVLVLELWGGFALPLILLSYKAGIAIFMFGIAKNYSKEIIKKRKKPNAK